MVNFRRQIWVFQIQLKGYEPNDPRIFAEIFPSIPAVKRTPCTRPAKENSCLASFSSLVCCVSVCWIKWAWTINIYLLVIKLEDDHTPNTCSYELKNDQTTNSFLTRRGPKHIELWNEFTELGKGLVECSCWKLVQKRFWKVPKSQQRLKDDKTEMLVFQCLILGRRKLTTRFLWHKYSFVFLYYVSLV